MFPTNAYLGSQTDIDVMIAYAQLSLVSIDVFYLFELCQRRNSNHPHP